MKHVMIILSSIGAITLLALLVFVLKYGATLGKFDSGAFNAYATMAGKVLKTVDPAKGFILKKKMLIPEGMNKQEAIDNAIEVMDGVVSEHGLAVVNQNQ